MHLNLNGGMTGNRYQIKFAKKNVGINEVAEEDNAISIWNTNDVIIINGKELQRVVIYNILGQEVYSSSLAGEKAVIDSRLANGTYTIKAYAKNSSKSEKLIIR